MELAKQFGIEIDALLKEFNASKGNPLTEYIVNEKMEIIERLMAAREKDLGLD